MKLDFLDKIINLFNPNEYKNEEDYVRGILTEYKNKHVHYEDFRKTLHKALEAFLVEKGYKYQISSRTKTFERLKEKLIRKKEGGRYYNSLGEIEDLAGIRIIFYTESDKEKFIEEIQKEISGSMKFEERIKDNGYHATHLVMTFGPDRLRLSEYRHFADLKSEVQITSIFHHAWAEIEHDLIYKDVHGFKKQNPEKFKLMQQKMQELLEKYIKKAAQELEKIIQKNIN